MDYSLAGIHSVDLLGCIIIGDDESSIPCTGRVVAFEDTMLKKVEFTILLCGGRTVKMSMEDVLARIVYRPGW